MLHVYAKDSWISFLELNQFESYTNELVNLNMLINFFNFFFWKPDISQ